MSLKYAILGFLSLEGMSGYTLKTKYFDGSVAHFWPADQAQIYRTLQALERDGMATSDHVPGDTRPAQRVYRLTDSGLADLKKWLAEVHPPSAHRNTFLVQTYFSRLNKPQDFEALLKAERHRQQAALAELEKIELDIEAAPTPELAEQYRFGRLVVDYGRRRAAMEIEWLEASLAELGQATD